MKIVRKEFKEEVKKLKKLDLIIISICILGIIFNGIALSMTSGYESINWNYGVGIKDGKAVQLNPLLSAYSNLFGMTIVSYEKPVYDATKKAIIIPSVTIKNDDMLSGYPGFYKIKVYTRNACNAKSDWDTIGIETGHIVLFGNQTGKINNIEISNLPNYPINIKMELLYGVGQSVGPIPTPGQPSTGIGLGSYSVNDIEFITLKNAGGTYVDPRQELGLVACGEGETPIDPNDPLLDTRNPKMALYVGKGRVIVHDEFEIAIEAREGLNLQPIDGAYTVKIGDKLICQGKVSYGTASCKVALGESYLSGSQRKDIKLEGEVTDSKGRTGTSELTIKLQGEDISEWWDSWYMDLIAQMAGFKDGAALQQWMIMNAIMAFIILICVGIVGLMLVSLFFKVLIG